MPIIPSDVQDLVDNPGEFLHVELKEWLDLRDDIVRAKLARHLAALCNHGGGYLIFGFKDDSSPAEPHPGDVSKYDHDAIGGIIDRYLAPTFQCEVFTVIQQGTANSYPVVRIPGHGNIPVCAKRNGPHDKKNNPQGVRQGEYYIRAPGPKSVAIETPEQWKALIHRCVINERESVLASISKILQATTGKFEGKSLLDEWHESMHSYYLNLVKLSPTNWPVEIRNNHYQLSYRIVGGGWDRPLMGSTLLEAIRSSGARVRGVVNTGWDMFYPFTRDEIKPRFVLDGSDDDEQDAIETTLLGVPSLTGLPDFWRITTDGRATIIRPYREDRETPPHLKEEGLGPGMWLSPIELVREILEVVIHAKEFAKNFEGVDTVEFKCTWYGLKNRLIADFDPLISWHQRKCHVDKRSTRAKAPLAVISASPLSIVTELASPLAHLFDGWEITPQKIDSWKKRFKVL